MSLAALGPANRVFEIRHPAGVWKPREAVFESVMFSEYHDMALSLLIYSARGPDPWSENTNEREIVDAFDALER